MCRDPSGRVQRKVFILKFKVNIHVYYKLQIFYKILFVFVLYWPMVVHTHTIPDPTVQRLLALTPVDQATDAKQYMRGSTVFTQAGPVYSDGECQVDRRDDT